LSDLVNTDGDPLYVGQQHFKKCKKKFTNFVKPHDIKASLCLLSYLFLKNHSVTEEKSFVFNSAMLSVKASLEGEALHTNSIGKPNKMLTCFVIDFLAMSLFFDCFHVHNSLVATVPYSKKQLSSNEQQMLQHNQDILIESCLQHNPTIVQKYFMNTGGENIFSMHSYIFVLHYFIQTVNSFNFIGDIGWNVGNLDSLWVTSTEFVRKFDAGIVSSFEFYKQTFTNKKITPLWVHHVVILQIFHPFFCNLDTVYFWNKNAHDIVGCMTSDIQQNYKDIYQDFPNFDYVWLGKNTNGSTYGIQVFLLFRIVSNNL
jgi:hypothetical protein